MEFTGKCRAESACNEPAIFQHCIQFLLRRVYNEQITFSNGNQKGVRSSSMYRSKKAFIAVVSLVLVLSILLGCLPNKQGGFTCAAAPLLGKIKSFLPASKKPGQPAAPAAGPTRPHPPVRTGNITTGQAAEAATQTIGASGGTIAISKPGDPLDGLVIDVPPAAYAGDSVFKVRSAPITGQTFGSDINPVSPMITVDNGGAYSGEMMYVRVPARVPEGSFAMGFFYDEKTGQLQGMPLAGTDAGSVTVATRHFSSFFISMIEKTLLKKDMDSGFRPGIDDWQFTNYGSFIAPGGHCEGQALTAMWYYCTQPDGKDLCLYGRYDNNGVKPATPELWQDDSLGYRFCSVIQSGMRFGENTVLEDFWSNLSGIEWKFVNNKWKFEKAAGISDEAIFNLFAYSIRATGEPQEAVILSNAGGGHAMVVYKVVGNALYVADPNYPGNTDRKITYYSGDGKFKPYSSGGSRAEIEAGNAKSYEKIIYAAKSTVVPWDIIAGRWLEFKNGTIGNDVFPPYSLQVCGEQGARTPLTDGFVTDNKMMLLAQPAFRQALTCYRDGNVLPADNNGRIELVPGNNLLGLLVESLEPGKPKKYIDFKYFNVKYEDAECKTPPPANLMAVIQKTTKFKCELLNLPTTIVGSGSLNRWVPGFKFTKHFYVPGNAIALGGEGAMDIRWSGTSFSGGGTNGYPDKLTGSVCYGGGKVLLSFDYVLNDPKDNLKISVKDLPCDPKYLVDPEYVVRAGVPPTLRYMSSEAPEVKKYFTRLEWTSHEEQYMGDSQPRTWDAALTGADWTGQCGFMLTIK